MQARHFRHRRAQAQSQSRLNSRLHHYMNRVRQRVSEKIAAEIIEGTFEFSDAACSPAFRSLIRSAEVARSSSHV